MWYILLISLTNEQQNINKNRHIAGLGPVAAGGPRICDGGVHCSASFAAPPSAYEPSTRSIRVCSLTGLATTLQRMPELAGLWKYWHSELTHTAVRSLTRVRQPDQSSVSLLSWYSALLWVTETSTASRIPNDGWCTEMLPLRSFSAIFFSSLLFLPHKSCSLRDNLTSSLCISLAGAQLKFAVLKTKLCVSTPFPCLCPLVFFRLLPFVCCPLQHCFLSLPRGRWV